MGQEQVKLRNPQMDEPHVDEWLKQLTSPDPELRNAAAHMVILYNFTDKSAVEPLITSLSDPDSNVRAGAASSLGLLQDLRAVEPLIATLGDEETFVQASAVEALGKLR